MNKQNRKFSSASNSNSTSETRWLVIHKNIFDAQHLHQSQISVESTDEDVVHRKYFCVNNYLVSLVEL